MTIIRRGLNRLDFGQLSPADREQRRHHLRAHDLRHEARIKGHIRRIWSDPVWLQEFQGLGEDGGGRISSLVGQGGR